MRWNYLNPTLQFYQPFLETTKNEQGWKANGTVDGGHKVLQWNVKLGSTHSLFDLSLEQNAVLPRMQVFALPSKKQKRSSEQVFDWPSTQYDLRTSMMVKCNSIYNAICAKMPLFNHFVHIIPSRIFQMMPHQLPSNWDWDRRWISTNSLGVTLVLKEVNLSKKEEQQKLLRFHPLYVNIWKHANGIMISNCSVAFASLEALVELACTELQDLRKIQHVRNMQYWRKYRKYVVVHMSFIDCIIIPAEMTNITVCIQYTCWMWARSDVLNKSV